MSEKATDASVQKEYIETLEPNKILIAEFGYAQETAAQAMEDRHKMVNYYLIIVGVLLNAVATLTTKSKSDENLLLAPEQLKYAASAFLFTLFIIVMHGLTTLVESYRPPMPTSTTAKSTLWRAKCRNAIAVTASKNVGCSRPGLPCMSSTIGRNSSTRLSISPSLIRVSFIIIRSVKSTR